MEKTIQLTQRDVLLLTDLLTLIREEDLLDLDAYDSISRAEKIANAWGALKVLDRILQTNEPT